MPLPDPEPGLVISYEFLWSHEADDGQDRGNKIRPALIILVTTENNEKTVWVSPITHTEPNNEIDGVEIPERVRNFLGLDNKRQWIIVNEINSFRWPGIDVYPIVYSSGTYEYGMIPPKLFDIVKTAQSQNSINKIQRNEIR